jgi:glycerate-2-kinase
VGEREDTEFARVTAVTLAIEGIRAADPLKAVRDYVGVSGDEVLLRDGTRIPLRGRVVVVGAGKATGGMAKAVEELFGDRIARGVVAVPEPLAEAYSRELRRIEVVPSTHPRTSEKSLEAGRRVLEAVRGLSEEDLVVALFSGGGSALLEYPVEGVSIEDIAETSILLMRAGADIFELNTVRKHLSKIKGGWLARHLQPAACLTLMISDVVGDRMDTIASGPTVPDPTTFEDALGVLSKYGLREKVPRSVIEYLEAGREGRASETPKPGDPIFSRVFNRIVASNRISLEAMAEKARSMGYNVLVLTSMLEGEAREVGRVVASIAKEIRSSGRPVPPPAVVLLGGETTVTVRGSGVGGRNQELALSAAIAIRGWDRIAILSIGSDGRDGPTDVAGAVVDGFTYEKALSLGLKPEEFLERNDSYSFFKQVGGHVTTGYTGTNVNDFVIIVVEKEKAWD